MFYFTRGNGVYFVHYLSKRRYVSLNSRIIHQRETYIYFTIFVLVGVLIANMFIHMVFVLAYPLL
ncbi:hypothetical protein K8Z37_33520, partial [Bacillus thuringiensis]|nr:hypothetical protein [Bacillus thuringiensis]MCC3946015.1 hypothetical protein [Bacillus thuringiensis]MCC4002251.1 hypothetical protein [Bacillus thuringiensis]MCQ6373246.1 hypothetical protein [Bacillus cereus]